MQHSTYWKNPFERNIAEIKEKNISGPNGLKSMANHHCRMVSLTRRTTFGKLFSNEQEVIDVTKPGEMIAIEGSDWKVEYVIVGKDSKYHRIKWKEVGCGLNVIFEIDERITIVENERLKWCCISRENYFAIAFTGVWQLRK